MQHEFAALQQCNRSPIATLGKRHHQSMKTAYATIKGFEVMRMVKKGQFTWWIDAIGGGTEARFVNRLRTEPSDAGSGLPMQPPQ
jgi:hypothetical protein